MNTEARVRLREAYRCDERAALAPLVEAARLPEAQAMEVLAAARRLAARARELLQEEGGVEALLREYDLSSEEGVLLMSLAEALLRIPDQDTRRRLIRDKLARGDWDAHLGRSRSLFVNASTWGLLFGGRAAALMQSGAAADAAPALARLAARLGEAALQPALSEALAVMARGFVISPTIDGALRRAARAGPWRWSFDCLGEAARGAGDVARYFAAYRGAVAAVAGQRHPGGDPAAAPGISVKLSALHPRYEYAQRGRVMQEVVPRLRVIAVEARDAGTGLTVDAEEADRLELGLDVFEAVYRDAALDGWTGFGMAVQAYQKRAPALLEYLAALARAAGRRIPVRLVKGAYWDSEIKRAQERGLDGYPVFTRKAATDVSYLACAHRLLAAGDALYPQFATHNAYTVAYILAIADGRDFEFQRLHGMGEPLYRALSEDMPRPPPCRVYAPVGEHDALLPYLVRRLLENGANTSFVNRLADSGRPIERLVTDPVRAVVTARCTPHPRIPAPADLYGEARRNSAGVDLSDPRQTEPLEEGLREAMDVQWTAAPLVDGGRSGGTARTIADPADRRRTVGQVFEAPAALVERAFAAAAAVAPDWETVPAARRAAILEQGADLFEVHRHELMALIIREGGRTLPDAAAEVREAVDALRYYAAEARAHFSSPVTLPGPTGELNQLWLRGRGVFVTVSPWNFPVAIFTAQAAAALAAGNAVIAKPARQTPLAGGRAVELLHRAGVPPAVLQFLPGSAAVLGRPLLSDPRLGGVAMTGATETAWSMQEALAARRGAIVPLIAETGGQNMMIVDSSALIEQVVSDAMGSAFNSAGQRCSALRVLFVQEDVADRLIALLAEALAELTVGDPALLATDVGPVIDDAARRGLEQHLELLRARGRLIAAARLDGDAAGRGSFFAPCLAEIPAADVLQREVFGPILHVVRFPGGALDAVIDAVNASGYGLTLGVQSRLEETWERVRARARAGNLYINRNMIGSVIGVQPFGGEGLSGTGPKAGGPHYLTRFAVERTVTVNTAAVGGNAGLLSLDEEDQRSTE